MMNNLRLFYGITSALYAPNGNGITGDISRVLSPELSYQIGQHFKQNNTEGTAPHILSHALLGAATSYATGNDPTTGALSAMGAEATAKPLSQYLFGTSDTSKLTTEQKQTVSSIASLAGLGVGATTGDVAEAVNASEVGKVAVENNGGANYMQKGRALNARACRNGDVNACEVRTLGDIFGEYADKYHDLTIYSVSAGVFSYTIVVNNRNGNVWIGGMPKSDEYQAGYGITINPKDYVNRIQDDIKAKGFKKPVSLGISVQVGTVIGAGSSEAKVDQAIGGRSLGLQGCHYACLSVSRGEGKEGYWTVATGVGTTQVGVGGTVMRQLTDTEKKILKDLGVLK
ncbi:VENN motif pre-toxin domain-containing protein [Moraxella nasovis]|uniref:VENN motif pre-toxin domain-containing protein n=1 Tax=Moraxella nasovis TaxID=2904121 RepID=UPI001F60FDAF|nr:VENN motif pre-toxin domain-containing protein [Moraxella nasovis]UNU73955.1 VENN motif pre-toxin domain-containing protein [Moraxella nasovis]